MSKQKVFAVVMSYPSASYADQVKKHGYMCSEITELNKLLEEGWKINNIYLHTPAGSANMTTGIIVLEEGNKGKTGSI